MSDRLQKKLDSLIYRANDPSSTQSERDMAEAAAKRLILQEGILASSEETVTRFTYKSYGRLPTSTAVLFQKVCKFLGAVGVQSKSCLVVYCYPSQKEKIFSLFESYMTALDALAKTKRGCGRSYITSFREGIVVGISASLEQKLPEDLQEKALVFVNSHDKIMSSLNVRSVTKESKDHRAFKEGFDQGLDVKSNRVEGSQERAKYLLKG